MKNTYLIICCFLLCCCSEVVKKEDLTLLDGYWEISEVKFPDGTKRTYEINATVDYIEIDKMQGFRKKVQPRVDGSFDTSDDAVFFSIVTRNNTIYLSYKNEMNTWEEEIKTLSSETLSLRNEDQITYIYKRFQPLNLD